MEKDIDKIKDMIKRFIEKYQVKTLKIKTDISHSSKINSENPEKWIVEHYSTVNKIDINLTK